MSPGESITATIENLGAESDGEYRAIDRANPGQDRTLVRGTHRAR
jgi:hypothetical protein